MTLTHFDDAGRPQMVDVTAKAETSRMARAEAHVKMSRQTLDLVMNRAMAKGDVIATAELAGIMAAKRTADLIPLCHPLPISKVRLVITPMEALPGLHIEAEVRCTGRTGVEMEALTAASVAALTVYDMLKAAEKGMEISGLRLLHKEGGKSGTWTA